jgi:EAL domain-containing protein (putative c-di-GMP-specific phosphodiesterase class I)
MFLSFNLSPVATWSIQDTGKAGVSSVLKKTGFDPRRLEIEITETGVMSDPTTAEKPLSRICAMRRGPGFA